jgi:hypothetical protein
MDTGNSFLRDKKAKARTYCSPPNSAQLKNTRLEAFRGNKYN